MNKFFISSLLSLTFIFSSAQLLADYASRMKERLPYLLEAKDLGVIGEGTDGFVYIREGDSEKIKKIVTSENEDRKILFNTMATKTGGSIDEVANRFSKALVQKSKKGHWFRKSSGEWMQRK
tara:strand:+ start:282 stop:647 length:366 start_codon:yes stop_codon:yes gene_type:complete